MKDMAKMEEQTNLLAKLDEVDILTQSQKDKLNLQETAHTNLCNFLNSHIIKLQSKNELKAVIEKKFIDALTGNTDEEIPLIGAIKIYEILCKSETDADSAVLNLFNKNPNIFVSVNDENIKKNENNLTKEETEAVTSLSKLIKKLESSEMPEKGGE